jgi:hypothetical protein
MEQKINGYKTALFPWEAGGTPCCPEKEKSKLNS